MQIYWLANPRCAKDMILRYVKDMIECFTSWKIKLFLQDQTATLEAKYILRISCSYLFLFLVSICLFVSLFFHI